MTVSVIHSMGSKHFLKSAPLMVQGCIGGKEEGNLDVKCKLVGCSFDHKNVCLSVLSFIQGVPDKYFKLLIQMMDDELKYPLVVAKQLSAQHQLAFTHVDRFGSFYLQTRQNPPTS